MFKLTKHSSRIDEGNHFFGDFMSSLVFSAINVRLSLSSSDAHQHKGFITSLIKASSDLLEWYDTYAITDKADKKIEI